MPSILLPPRYQKPPLGAQIDWSHPLSRGLVGWWLFNEGIGKTANDLASRNNGVWSGTLGSQWQAGRVGGTAAFNGTNNWVTLPASAALNITGDLTIVAWAKTSTSGGITIFGGYQGGGAFPGYGMGLGFAGAGKQCFWDGHGWFGATSATYTDGLWHAMAITTTQTTIAFYRDGKADGTAAQGVRLSWTGTRAIGASQQPGSYLTGQIDYAAVYNRALSASEIARLYMEPYCMIQAPAMYRYISSFGGFRRLGMTGGMADLTGKIHG